MRHGFKLNQYPPNEEFERKASPYRLWIIAFDADRFEVEIYIA